MLYLPLLYYFFLNMRDYSSPTVSSVSSIASIVFSWLFFLVFLLFFVLSLYKVIAFFKTYPKLSGNITKATDLILQ